MAKEFFSQEIVDQIRSSAVLSDLGILYERQEGKIVIEPFSQENLSTSSYDLSLGEYYFVRQVSEAGMVNIYDPNAPNKIWGDPRRAILAKELKKKRFTSQGFWSKIQDDDQVIIVPPAGVLLVHSHEFAGAREDYTTMVRSKSTLERLGVTVAISAGWGDVGFINRWTLLLTNEHKSWEVPLKVGTSIAQIIFFKCRPVQASYVQMGGKYQETEDLAQLIKSWEPENMLPKLN